METGLDPGARFMVDDLLNFTLDAGDKTLKTPSSSSSLESSNPDPHHHQSLSFPEEIAEEELEWLSNKDAFPAVETCLDILSDNPGIVLNHNSPVSVLENSTTSTSNSTTTITSCCGGGILVPVRYPVKARSKRPRRGFFSGLPRQQSWWSQANFKNIKQELAPAAAGAAAAASSVAATAASPPQSATTTIGRRCQHCHAEKTPQWRAGPMGPKTLCNACGVRYKSGRLVPEYRPASSPTFSSLMHSNSHRKVMEMRRQKQMGGMVFNEACGYRVG